MAARRACGAGAGYPARSSRDAFAQPATALEQQAAAALAPETPGAPSTPETPDDHPGLDDLTLAAAREYGTLLQAYERLFWETLTTPAG
ncbi:hypothetical protein OG535_36700 [Kitasatospora sp. NBC_00085]|uniref:hypothetical protein n=1 Tax=unclassified Kitasatospora TaxID=2633591 RepID=UPI00324A284C